jgi:hypothetical protein
MKKLIAMISVMVLGVAVWAADKTFSLASASGATTASITNDSVDQVWVLKAVYGVSGATNDTVTLSKTSGGADIPVGSDVLGAETAVQITVPALIEIRPSEVFKITRTLTNTTLKGFVVTGAN